MEGRTDIQALSQDESTPVNNGGMSKTGLFFLLWCNIESMV